MNCSTDLWQHILKPPVASRLPTIMIAVSIRLRARVLPNVFCSFFQQLGGVEGLNARKPKKIIGSSGRTRVYNPSVNGRITHSNPRTTKILKKF